MKKHLLAKRSVSVRWIAVVMFLKASGALLLLMLFFACVLKAQKIVYENEVLWDLGVASKYGYVLDLDYVILGVAATASATLATCMCWWLWSPFRTPRIMVSESPEFTALMKSKK